MTSAVDDLAKHIEARHGGAAKPVQAVPVRETFRGSPVWEGTVHVFDLKGHPNAARAYAWSSPIEGSDKRRFYPCYILTASDHRRTRCRRLSWRSISRGPGDWDDNLTNPARSR